MVYILKCIIASFYTHPFFLFFLFFKMMRSEFNIFQTKFLIMNTLNITYGKNIFSEKGRQLEYQNRLLYMCKRDKKKPDKLNKIWSRLRRRVSARCRRFETDW
ncbi:hypothetical protein D3C87_864430 [compost metagenome]